MADKELAEKVGYFQEQDLLDISDDETGFKEEESFDVERALADSKAMPPPTLVRQRSSFLGPTPKEELAQRKAPEKLPFKRQNALTLTRSATAPEAETLKSFPSSKPKRKSPPPEGVSPRKKLKHTASLPDIVSKAQVTAQIPFYKEFGIMPRELKSGKSVKLADNIQIEPESKQLLRRKVIYFYPNDDISMARRLRIHKVIQLGSAWVTNWRDDVTHVMVDDASYTYNQLLKHLNRAGFPRKVVLVKFDPYVPQCIQFNTVLEPTAGRFIIKGAPQPAAPTLVAEPSPSLSSQGSLQIKASVRQLAAQNSQKTSSISTEDSHRPLPVPDAEGWSDSEDEIVKDSFVQPSSDPIEQPTPAVDPYNDALSEAIKQTKAISHLPLDEEEEEPSSAPEDSDSGSDVDSPKSTKVASKSSSKPYFSATTKPNAPKTFNQLAFQCMAPRSTHSTSSQNPNHRTIEILDEMCKYYDQMGDNWRTLAYRRGISTLRKQTTKISTKEQAEALPFIGSRLAAKIEEIVLTDRLKRLDSTKDDPNDQVLRLFLGVYGVGVSQAGRWLQQGHRTLEDLLHKAKLTESQKVGIEHYQDFATRIPRSEVSAHNVYVRTALQKIDRAYQVHVMGSYRRGTTDSGDIDLIITKRRTPVSAMREVVFGKLVPRLFGEDFLKVSLATSRRHDDGTGTKWLGASCLPSSTVWRRLDLLLVPEEEMGAALIYFTGNDIFNRSLRLLASKMGMRLNQRGLYKDVIRGRNRERITEGTLVEGRDEKRIFEVLGVPWREPMERVC
ncbi:hypothetical protein K491DRAFT_693926 [Lophiostoma macrostomum CBS 122681]|uniref:DNA-directed DNA polymerase n=1 Tax=Lophiostoma macrostomum CBS 122681 TaxID=1314788 RepID=A0A6A6T300_9PLEO|nr:hypothetical protein K491DRAFT_693926 [Lophiostoma macrostomum CBS 122681]